MINSLTIILLIYVTAGFALFFGLFYCALKCTENAAATHYECLQIMRPLYVYQARAAHQDFERIPVNDHDINGIPQRIIVPRVNALN